MPDFFKVRDLFPHYVANFLPLPDKLLFYSITKEYWSIFPWKKQAFQLFGIVIQKEENSQLAVTTLGKYEKLFCDNKNISADELDLNKERVISLLEGLVENGEDWAGIFLNKTNLAGFNYDVKKTQIYLKRAIVYYEAHGKELTPRIAHYFLKALFGFREEYTCFWKSLYTNSHLPDASLPPRFSQSFIDDVGEVSKVITVEFPRDFIGLLNEIKSDILEPPVLALKEVDKVIDHCKWIAFLQLSYSSRIVRILWNDFFQMITNDSELKIMYQDDLKLRDSFEEKYEMIKLDQKQKKCENIDTHFQSLEKELPVFEKWYIALETKHFRLFSILKKNKYYELVQRCQNIILNLKKHSLDYYFLANVLENSKLFDATALCVLKDLAKKNDPVAFETLSEVYKEGKNTLPPNEEKYEAFQPTAPAISNM